MLAGSTGFFHFRGTWSMAESKRFLIVDDESMNLKVLEGLLKGLGHQAVPANSGKEAMSLLDESIDIVLLDVMMPDMDGFEVAAAIRERKEFRELPIVMVTALSSKSDRLKAVEAGANDFITKPLDKTELRVRATSLLRMKEARDEVKRYQHDLEEMVRVRTEALELAFENLRELQQATQEAHLDTVRRLAIAAEYRDEDTARHIERMSRFSALLAEKYGLAPEEVETVRHAAPMHDVGKIGIPDAILLKPAKLDKDEWETMKSHTTIGGRILDESDSELLQAGRVIALSHHEKWDGSGYPNGLSGEDIPLYGRICAVADVFDALTTVRPYKEAFSVEKTLDIMKEGRGSHFEPKVFDLFMENMDAVLEIKERFSD